MPRHPSPVSTMRLEQICREAGHIALGLWPGHGHTVDAWEKAPGSPVCEADLAVDAFLREELGALLPSAGWLSEETVDDPERLDRSHVWLVDPIDGTRDFLRGRTGWAVSVALVSAGTPILAQLIAPAREGGGEVWSARRGVGAWCNGERLSVSATAGLAGARIPAHDLAREDRLLAKVARPNSIALRMAMVAAGEADVLATLRWGHEWDVAAAALIAAEAGANVTDALGAPLRFNKADPRAFGLALANPALHPALLTHVQERAERLRAAAT